MSSRIAMILFVTLLGLVSLRAQADAQEFMHSGADYVRVEPKEADAPVNDHPATLSSAQVATFLSQLQVQMKGMSVRAPAALFTEPSIARLAPAISEALTKVQAHEDITFAIVESRSGLVGNDSYVTSGRIFVRDGELNMVLGEMVRPLRALVDRRSGASDRVLQPRAGYVSNAILDQMEIEPGSRRGARSRHALVTNATIRHPDAPDATRKDWAIASMTAVAAIDRVEHNVEQPLAPAPLPAPAESAPIEARLKHLRELHQQGLISEEVYREKQRELLREL